MRAGDAEGVGHTIVVGQGGAMPGAATRAGATGGTGAGTIGPDEGCISPRAATPKKSRATTARRISSIISVHKNELASRIPDRGEIFRPSTRGYWAAGCTFPR